MLNHMSFLNNYVPSAAILDFNHCDTSDTSQDQEDNQSKITQP